MDKSSNSIYDAYLCFDYSCVTANVDSFSVRCCEYDNCNWISPSGNRANSSSFLFYLEKIFIIAFSIFFLIWFNSQKKLNTLSLIKWKLH